MWVTWVHEILSWAKILAWVVCAHNNYLRSVPFHYIIGVRMPLRTSKSGMISDQNWMFVDRVGEGVANFRLFANVINE